MGVHSGEPVELMAGPDSAPRAPALTPGLAPALPLPVPLPLALALPL